MITVWVNRDENDTNTILSSLQQKFTELMCIRDEYFTTEKPSYAFQAYDSFRNRINVSFFPGNSFASEVEATFKLYLTKGSKAFPPKYI